MDDTYSFLREFADSWFLAVMFVIFIGAILWAFRPGSRKVHDDISKSIFRNEDKPAADKGSDKPDDDEEAR